ncbi:putative transferase CAF17, mitochondrial [Bombina bombina]|uniref:putative transferase CAF17, mitochondrial n=1 Tax=Bombina bombina TaxID=8345 RepID=UPI00235AA163|nr:putative transferase CAF17, mitochondrial [Bombina bombina]
MLLYRALTLLVRPWVRRISGVCCPLTENRALLRLRGQDTTTFLQGLITNDVERLQEGGALYAHLLNVQGRTLGDVIMYRSSKEQNGLSDVILECDLSAVELIQKHMKVYNFRRKIDISPCPELSVWAVISSQNCQDPQEEKNADPVLCTPDPRVAVMGWRLLTETGANPLNLLPKTHMGSFKEYSKHRYEQGVPEGVCDLPPGVALPLESNLVYMNGISFDKGCYIGQELTARTHHTGVIRKRLLPVQLSSPVPADTKEADIFTKSGKSAGKYRAGEGGIGLALLRLAHVNEELNIKTPGNESITVKPSIPQWWPKNN